MIDNKRISLEDCFPSSGRKVDIDLYNMVGYLRQEGYFRVEDSLFRVEGCVAKRCTLDDVINYVYDYMFKVRDKKGVVISEYTFHRNWFTQCIGRFRSSVFSLLGLGENSVEILRDTRDEIYFCFNNGVVVVRAEGVEFRSYEDVLGDRVIYEEKIIRRDINLMDLTDVGELGKVYRFPFADFAKKAIIGTSGGARDDLGYRTLMCAIGYMISGYKDPANAKMVFFSDVNNADSVADGRSGKSLCSSGVLRQVRNVAMVDGKQFSGQNQYKMDNVTSNTDIVIMQDVKSDFDKETLYNMITNDFEIGRKYKARQIIPFEVSPKIMADSNFGIRLLGGSDEARFVIIGFSHYWNRRHQPCNEYKKRFFTEWNDEDWNRFYHWLFLCCQKFLKYGVSDWRKGEVMAYSIYERFDKDLIDDLRDVLVQPNNFLTKPTKTSVWFETIPYWIEDKYSDYSYKMRTMREVMKALGYTKKCWSKSVRDKTTGRVTSEKLHWFEKNGNISSFDYNTIDSSDEE